MPQSQLLHKSRVRAMPLVCCFLQQPLQRSLLGHVTLPCLPAVLILLQYTHSIHTACRSLNLKVVYTGLRLPYALNTALCCVL